MIDLRTYQIDAIDRLRKSLREGKKRVLLHAPTGAGKTIIAGEIVRSAYQKGSSVLFLAHRKELIDQASQKFDDIGIPHGIIMREHWRKDFCKKIQIASIQTLVRREIPSFQLIIIDECHRAMADSYLSILKESPGAKVIGLTATPVRSDGKGLGDLFDDIVSVGSVRSLIESGHLVHVRHFAPTSPELSGVSSLGGDYNLDQLEKVMDQKILVGKIVEEWEKRGKGRQTIVFAVSVEHSIHLCREFGLSGISAKHLDASTPLPDREKILEDFRKGKIQIVSNCGILTEGYDNPSVSCVILARPTKSLGLYLQMAGRSLRPSLGKTETMILDHAGCGIAHGLVTEDREWSLTESRKKKEKDPVPSLTACEMCFAVYETKGNPECPICGHEREIKSRDPEKIEGELEELTIENRQNRKKEEGSARTLPELLALARMRGYKPGWAYHRFNARQKR